MSAATPVSLRNASDEARFGGKAANLARLIRAGLKTEPGLVLGVEVLQGYFAQLGIDKRVEAFFLRLAEADAFRQSAAGLFAV